MNFNISCRNLVGYQIDKNQKNICFNGSYVFIKRAQSLVDMFGEYVWISAVFSIILGITIDGISLKLKKKGSMSHFFQVIMRVLPSCPFTFLKTSDNICCHQSSCHEALSHENRIILVKHILPFRVFS